jgi:hypothetical protein
MTPRPSFALAAFLLIGILFSADTARAADCDCSCTALINLQAGMVIFEQQLDRGLDATMTLELQSRLACLESCADRWMACPVMIDGLADDSPDRPPPSSGRVEDQSVNFDAG